MAPHLESHGAADSGPLRRTKGAAKRVSQLLNRLGAACAPTTLRRHLHALQHNHVQRVFEMVAEANEAMLCQDNFVRVAGVRIMSKKVGAAIRVAGGVVRCMQCSGACRGVNKADRHDHIRLTGVVRQQHMGMDSLPFVQRSLRR